MKFLYEQSDIRPQSNCFLLWNGLGGYCSMSGAFCAPRADQGILVAAIKAPNERISMVHRLRETLRIGDEAYYLSTQHFADGTPDEDGWRHMTRFSYGYVPQWEYRVQGVTVLRRCAMAYGRNTSTVLYTLENTTDKPCSLDITPFLKFAPKETALAQAKTFTLENNRIRCDGYTLYIHTDGQLEAQNPQWQLLSYPEDAKDGRPEMGLAGACCRISAAVLPGQTARLEVVFSLLEQEISGWQILRQQVSRLQALESSSHFSDPIARQLALSADAFIAHRDSTGGKTILAGYPLFSDWGRDTMIALPGCTLATGRYEDAKSILRTFLAYEKDGLVPNLFPEGDLAPMYNTVDAALLLIDCVWQYFQHTGDLAFVREAWPVMARIIACYRKGTHHAIGMDEDGLIFAGKGLDQVTWMDVCIDGILPTPRHGKPVEINAYWYNALKIMEQLAPEMGADGAEYGSLAQKVKDAFHTKFYIKDKGYLKDVLSGTDADEQIRCNQIWALAMSFTMLPQQWELRVLDTVRRHLLTLCGLRTLSAEDQQYQPFYGGSQYNRDMAYHQGTTWVFPMGAYLRTCLRLGQRTEVTAWLQGVAPMLREGCAGQLPEVYDGANPREGKGCFAQAWSVGEMIRVFEALEQPKHLDKTKPGWWKDAVFYQIYPKSFQDTTGSGVGDLKGIISRLDYLETLGIDGIWLSPVCMSPQVDNGYDISDYCSVDPMFGTMEDMETLIAEAKKRGISIILDLVLNHSSDQHPWFQEALKGPDSPYYDYYIWHDGTPDQPPNDMQSVFGGSAWTYVESQGQYYFHQFAPAQPDLNWENPALRRELYDSIRFWVDKGVEGFRLDVIDQIGKEADLGITINGPKLHDYLRELSANAFREDTLVSVGETWGADVDRARLYSAPDGSELSMVFQFQHMCLDQQGEKWDTVPLNLPQLKECFRRWQQGLHQSGWNSLFLNNHDLPRIVSRWGNDGAYRTESAKMLATMLHGMQGTPFIYQGEELGMTNIRLDIERYEDIEIRNLYRDRISRGYSHDSVMASIWARGRDNARTPMQWTAGENAGFTAGTPWLAINENHAHINAEAALCDPDSIFYYYQKLIQLRKTLPIFRDGTFTLLDPEDSRVFAYTRDMEHAHLLVVCNFTGEHLDWELPQTFREAQLLIHNYPNPAPGLRPYEAAMFYTTKRSSEL